MTSRLERTRVGDPLPESHHRPTITDLFFVNAALWNGHRIHFDLAYATGEEGYRDLIVQGPLQGDWMSQCVMEWLGEDGALLELEYSNRAPAHLGETFSVGGRVVAVDVVAGEVRLELFVRDEAGEVLAPGRALVRLE